MSSNGVVAGARHAARRRIWVHHVAVDADKLEMRVRAARARGTLTPAQDVIAQGIHDCVLKARAAALRDDPVPGRLANWWRGTLVEAAYRNMHTARAQLIDLYDEDELRAEIPMVVARANATLHRDDPRRITIEQLEAEGADALRARMRRVVGDSYEQLDLEHARLRSFRNIVLLQTVFLVVLMAGTLYVLWRTPDLVPLCFQREVAAGADTTTVVGRNCPTSSGPGAAPAPADVMVVAALGALGGALAATLSIRNLKGTSTPYDVPVALAFLKVPLGAMTALLALIAIQGDFVPGLSVLDSQGQILAYALVFGFAQQAFSRLLDQRAQTLLEGLPGGTGTEPDPVGASRPEPPVAREPAGTSAGVPPAEQPPAAPTPVADDGATPPGDEAAPTAADQATGPGAPPADSGDRPVDEPEGATQEDQLALLRESGNARDEVTEDEEARMLEAEFGPPDASGIYRSRQDAVVP